MARVAKGTDKQNFLKPPHRGLELDNLFGSPVIFRMLIIFLYLWLISVSSPLAHLVPPHPLIVCMYILSLDAPINISSPSTTPTNSPMAPRDVHAVLRAQIVGLRITKVPLTRSVGSQIGPWYCPILVFGASVPKTKPVGWLLEGTIHERTITWHLGTKLAALEWGNSVPRNDCTATRNRFSITLFECWQFALHCVMGTLWLGFGSFQPVQSSNTGSNSLKIYVSPRHSPYQDGGGGMGMLKKGNHQFWD